MTEEGSSKERLLVLFHQMKDIVEEGSKCSLECLPSSIEELDELLNESEELIVLSNECECRQCDVSCGVTYAWTILRADLEKWSKTADKNTTISDLLDDITFDRLGDD